MFKSAKRRSEKSKIKAVFQLQFQATEVPQVKAKSLTISLVPADVGKPTVRLEKAAIVDGTCFWKNPVYETVKLIRDPKTRKFNEKCYYFIVSSGSSKAGLLGEVAINFADYAEEAKPSTVSLPVKTSNNGGTGTILHVTIHNMQDSADLRYCESIETPVVKSQDRSLTNQIGNNDRNGNSNLSFTEEECINNLASENSENTRNFRDLLGEDPMILQDNTTFRQDSVPKKSTTDAFPENVYMHQISKTDCSMSSASDGSIVDLLNSPEDKLLRDRSPETSSSSVERFIRKISMLERQAEVSELELQSVRKQIVKERKRGQDLSRQISSLKEERNAMETEDEQLKCREISNHLQIETEKLKVELEETMQKFNYEKELGATLRLQLQKTEDSNSELVHAVKELDEILEQKNREVADLSAIIKASKNDQKDPKEVPVCTDEVDMLKQEIADLNCELEVYRKDREELMMHMDQLAMDYDVLKQENHDLSLKLQQHEIEKVKMQNECSQLLATIEEFELQMERKEKEIEEQALELTESSEAINNLEAQVESLEKELEKQAQGFEDDLEGITSLKIEQEQRAIRAEEALRKARSKNAVAAERVQEEFQRLSVQMSSKLDVLQKANEELGLMKEQYEEKLQKLLNQSNMKAKQIEQMSQELKEKDMRIEHFEKQEVEIRTLKGKIERLKRSNSLSAEAEQKEKRRNESDGMAHMKTSLTEQEMLQMWSKEREELKKENCSVRKEAQKLQEESSTFRSLKDEKETMVRILQSDIERLRVQYNELKDSLFEVELEKENLRKEVFKLEGDLQKKEEVIIFTEKKLHSNSEQARNRDTEQISLKGGKSAMDAVSEKLNFVELIKLNLRLPGKSSTAGTNKENGEGTAPVTRGIETFSEKCVNISPFPNSDENYVTQVLSEMALMKERNTSMEGELREMQDRYSEISLKFAEVEGERQQLVMTVRNLKNTKC